MIKLVSLDVDGFKNLKVNNLNFPPEGNILITGRNESGKSSLFEAVFFALTSKLLVQKSRGFIDAISFDKEMATIDLTFQKDGIPARIKKKIFRTRTGASVTIDFWENYTTGDETPISGKTGDIDSIIENFLGFDDQILLNSSFVKQKGLEGFMEESRQDRIKILNKLLNLEKISTLREQYKNEIKKREIKENFLENLLKIKEHSVEIELLEDNIKQENEFLSKFRIYNNIYLKIENYLSDFENISNSAKEIEEQITENNRIKKSLQDGMENLKEYGNLLNKKKDIENEIKLKKKEDESISKDLETKKNNLKEIEKEINQFKENQEVLQQNEADWIKIKEDVEKLGEYKLRITELENIKNEIKRHEIQRTSLEKTIREKEKEFHKNKNDLKITFNELIDNFKENVRIASELDDISRESEVKLKNLDEAMNLISTKKEIEPIITIKEKEKEDYHKKIEDYQNDKNKIVELEESLKENDTKLKDLRNKLSELKQGEIDHNQYSFALNEISSQRKDKESIIKEQADIKTQIKNLKRYIQKEGTVRDEVSKSLLVKLLPVSIVIIILGIVLSIIISPFFIVLAIIGGLITFVLWFREKNADTLDEKYIKDINDRIKHLREKEEENNEKLNVINKKISQSSQISEYDQKKPIKQILNDKKSCETTIIQIEEQVKLLTKNFDDLIEKLNSSDIASYQQAYEKINSEIIQLKKNLPESLHQKAMGGKEIDELKVKEQTIIVDVESAKIKKRDAEIKIKNFCEGCVDICNKLGISISNDARNLEKFINVLTNKMPEIEKNVNRCFEEEDWDQFFSYLSKFPLTKNLTSQLSEKYAIFQGEMNDFNTVSLQLKSKEEAREGLLISLPEKYQNDFLKFEEDLRFKTINKSEIENKIKILKEYFSNKELKDLIGNQKNLEIEIKKIETELEGLRASLQMYNEKYNEIKKSIPEEYESTEIETNKEKLSKTDQEITSLKTTIKNNWINYIKDVSEFLQSNTDDSIKVNEKNIKIKLNEVLQIYQKHIEQLILKLRRLIPDFTENSTEEDINTHIGDQQNKIGALKGEIKSSKSNIKDLKGHGNNAKIIESIEVNDENLRQQYEEASKDRNILEKAKEILEEGQDMILEKVLPKTEENLTKILPILTADRYKDAMISKDYKIKVFDSKLEDYVEKTLFSGGTNDQIALAIRLSFAMVTLPEDNLNESFIFLDEPLGFFDDERKTALIDFLTHGSIADKFAQRIVISNFMEIKKHFDFVIELENGRMIEQYSTGTLDSTQVKTSTKTLKKRDYISIEQVDYSEEEDYIEANLKIKNISDTLMDELQVSVPEYNMEISPRYIYDIKPGSTKDFTIGYNRRILEEEDIYFDLVIIIKEDNIKFYANQKFHYTPQFK